MTEPTDKQLEDFAVEEQFLLFCDVDEFTQIARAVLAKWGMLRADRIVVPTDTMEQELQKHYQRGYAAGQKASATQPTQAQAGAVPQRWKAVPVNPTPEMWKAAKSVPDPNPPYPPHYGLVWDAMLAASPTPPAEQQAAPKAAPAPWGGADWQDISTAPKDGTRFVAVGQNYGLDSEAQHTCIAQWLAGCWVEVSDWNGASKLKYLTHWMPLPPLPCSAARTPADSVLEDAQNIAQALTDRENQPNQYGVEFGMSGTHMYFKIGNQLFKLAYEPDEQEEFDFMKRMLVNAFSAFTQDVKTTPQSVPTESASKEASMARPDYCPVGNEPCQSMCDEPCSWSGSKRRREDDALIQQLVEALEDFDDAGPPGEGWKSAPLLSLLAAARARLEGKP